jgi:para-aminobenzoate synthetase/4-amino-4-deoxychorismate lyase
MDSAAAAARHEPFSLLETMRLEEGSVPRLERHLARMAAAARRFDYRWSEEAARAAVAAVAAAHPGGCWRLRLLVAPDGVPTIECTSQPAGPAGTWRLALAPGPIDPDDPFILHKTTRRRVYDAARQARPDVDDVILWNPREEITESTIGNLVVEIEGLRYTPPVSSGLLGGTFRAEQIEAGSIRERVITKAEAVSAARLWVINSVREWVPAVLVR